MKLREYREAAGYSQKDFSAKIGVAPNRYNQWENQKRQPDNESLIKIATALGISVDALLGRDIPSSNNAKEGTPMEQKISPEEPELNEGEKVLLELFRQIPDEAQKMYLEVLRASLKNQSKD